MKYEIKLELLLVDTDWKDAMFVVTNLNKV